MNPKLQVPPIPISDPEIPNPPGWRPPAPGEAIAPGGEIATNNPFRPIARPSRRSDVSTLLSFGEESPTEPAEAQSSPDEVPEEDPGVVKVNPTPS